jgi:hypothetical protein
MPRRCLLGLAVLWVSTAPAAHGLQRPPEDCTEYEAQVRADSSDLEAAFRLGRCSVRDYEMIAPRGDSTQIVFRSSWSVALRSLRRAVQREPGYSRAYAPLFRILFAETRDGCSFVTKICTHVSPVLRDGDSVITVPRLVHLNGPKPDTYDEVVRESHTTRRANLTEAVAVARHWARVAPEDRRPHEYLGRGLLYLGDPVAASTELEYAAVLGTAESRRELFWDRLDALVKSGRIGDAQRVLEEAVSDPGRDTTRLNRYRIASLQALLGR